MHFLIPFYLIGSLKETNAATFLNYLALSAYFFTENKNTCAIFYQIKKPFLMAKEQLAF